MQEIQVWPLGRKISCRRKWIPIPVSLPAKSCGQRSLVGYRPWSHKRVRHDLLTKQQWKNLLWKSSNCWKHKSAMINVTQYLEVVITVKDFSFLDAPDFVLCSPARQLRVLGHFSCGWLSLLTVAFQVPSSMGFSRQEYWCGLPHPPPGDLPDPGIKPMSPASSASQRWILYSWATGEAQRHLYLL